MLRFRGKLGYRSQNEIKLWISIAFLKEKPKLNMGSSEISILEGNPSFNPFGTIKKDIKVFLYIRKYVDSKFARWSIRILRLNFSTFEINKPCNHGYHFT